MFLDTNVLAYAVDPADPQKQARARHIVESHQEQAVISTQVMIEFSRFCTSRLLMSRASADSHLRAVAQLKTVSADQGLVLEASQIGVESDLPIFDAMIVAAATRARCALLLSEDFNDGQAFGQTVVKNPFA